MLFIILRAKQNFEYSETDQIFGGKLTYEPTCTDRIGVH